MNEWISVKDKLPEDFLKNIEFKNKYNAITGSIRCLINYKDSKGVFRVKMSRRLRVGEGDREYWIWIHSNNSITHWMFSPEPIECPIDDEILKINMGGFKRVKNE